MEEKIELCENRKVDRELVEKLKESMLPQEEFNKLGMLYGVFADPMRIKIIYSLFENEMCVCDLAAGLNTTQSNVSHHLAVLKANDLVSYQKRGKQVIYRLKDEHVQKIFERGLEHIREKE